MLTRKDFKTVKGVVNFTYLYDEQGKEYHLVNAHSLLGYVDYGYYLIIPLKKSVGWWQCLRKIITHTKKLES